MPSDTKPAAGNACAVVVGAGARAGIGGALCARFAAAGLPVYAVGRTAQKLEALAAEIRGAGGTAIPVVADVAKPEEVKALFGRIGAEGRAPELVAFNAALANVPTSLAATTPEFVEERWRVCCLAGFLVGQEAIARMLPQKRGTLIFTGATASLRGKPQFAAFAAAKAGLRAFAQAMARECGPKGIHVAHVVVDGVVDGDRVASFGHGVGKAFLLTKGSDGALKPDAVAESYWQLHLQQRSAWTHELDLRPFKEEF